MQYSINQQRRFSAFSWLGHKTEHMAPSSHSVTVQTSAWEILPNAPYAYYTISITHLSHLLSPLATTLSSLWGVVTSQEVVNTQPVFKCTIPPPTSGQKLVTFQNQW